MSLRSRVALFAGLGCYVLVGVASWAMPRRFEAVFGETATIIAQAVGLPAFWAVSAALNVAAMALLLGTMALAGMGLQKLGEIQAKRRSKSRPLRLGRWTL
jgi:Na+/H+ antiporter NhaD/arsenite permease-like protein